MTLPGNDFSVYKTSRSPLSTLDCVWREPALLPSLKVETEEMTKLPSQRTQVIAKFRDKVTRKMFSTIGLRGVIQNLLSTPFR